MASTESGWIVIRTGTAFEMMKIGREEQLNKLIEEKVKCQKEEGQTRVYLIQLLRQYKDAFSLTKLEEKKLENRFA